MEVRELRTFCVVARLRSMSRAAEALGVAQPTVTTHIKKLEDQLGIRLFDRIKRPLQLTLGGQKLAELALPLVEALEALGAKAAQAEEEGPVAVAATYDIASHVLLRAVRAYRATYPHVHLRIRTGHRGDVLHLVTEGEVDLGIIPGPERSPEFHFQPLFRYDRVLIAPLGHPLLKEPLRALDQMARWPLILMGPRSYTRTMLEAEFQHKGIPYDIVVELDSMDMIKRYVALGLGISVGPRLALDPEDLNELGVVDLGHLLPIEQAGMVVLRGKTLSTPAQNFLATLKHTLATRLNEGAGASRQAPGVLS